MTSLQPGSAVSMAAGRPDRSAKAMLFGLAALAVALFPASLRAAAFPVDAAGTKRDLLLEFENGQGYQFQRLTTASPQ
jgi:hypothetical protein